MTRSRPTRRQWLAVAALLVGLWVLLAPFSRPLPGGEPFSFEATPEIGCRTPVAGMLGDDQPIAEVYTSPLPIMGDPVVESAVDCTGRARFRVAVGSLLLIASVVMAARNGRPVDRDVQ